MSAVSRKSPAFHKKYPFHFHGFFGKISKNIGGGGAYLFFVDLKISKNSRALRDGTKDTDDVTKDKNSYHKRRVCMNKKLIAFGALGLALIMVTVALVFSLKDKNGTPGIEQSATPVPVITPMPSPDPAVPLISADAFMNPDNTYRGLMMLHSINNLRGSTDAKRAQTLADSGFGGVVTNIAWNSEYPNNVDAFKRVNAFAQEVTKKGFRVWIYDEDGYPSGTANIAVVDEEHMDYQAIGIGQYKIKGSGAGKQKVDMPKDMTKLFAAYVYPVKGTIVDSTKGVKVEDITITDGKITVDGMEGNWEVRLYGVFPCSLIESGPNGDVRTYPNLLNKDAVKRFIDLTYQQYKDNIENFADVVEAFFTDEPCLIATRNMSDTETFDYALIPYDSTVLAEFKTRYGYDLETVFPSLFFGSTAADMRVRANYMELIGDMMSENYIGQIEAWCKENGVEASGHMLLEEGLNYHVPLYGDLMKTFENMGYPGFDVLNMIPQSFVDGTLIGAKYASSTARWQNKEKVMFEICPVADLENFNKDSFNNAMGTLTLCYYGGGNQFTSYFSLINTSPTYGKQFNDYAARMGAMMDDATMTSGIGIYVPTTAAQGMYQFPETQNVYNGNIQTLDVYIRNAANMLQQNNMDYNFLSDAAIAAGKVQNGTLDINNTPYKVIFVPDAEVISIETLRTFDAFAKAGGKIIWAERMPYVATYEKDQAELTEIVSRYKDQKVNVSVTNTKLIAEIKAIADTKLKITPANTENASKIFNSPYYKNNRQFFFVVNTMVDDAEMTVSFEGAKGYRIYNPLDGSITESTDGKITVTGYRGVFVEPIL